MQDRRKNMLKRHLAKQAKQAAFVLMFYDAPLRRQAPRRYCSNAAHLRLPDRVEDFNMWERHNIAGQQAMTQGRTQEAEAQFKLALIEAEKMGLTDPKVPQTLNNLANCLRQQGRWAEAEPHYQKAIELKGNQVGPLHRDMIPFFENYAKMLRAMGREKEAEKLEYKAKAIFAKM